MRLATVDVNAIAAAAKAVLPAGSRVMLFGLRTDENLRHAAELAAVDTAAAMLRAWAHWKSRLPPTAIPGPA